MMMMMMISSLWAALASFEARSCNLFFNFLVGFPNLWREILFSVLVLDNWDLQFTAYE
jgi:hypothetical protein